MSNKNPRTDHIEKFMFKSGKEWKGNAKGRPKGSESLKSFVRRSLLEMPDEEKQAFLKEVMIKDPSIIWRMAEGNPHQDTETTVKIEKPTPILDLTDIKAIEANDEINDTKDAKEE